MRQHEIDAQLAAILHLMAGWEGASLAARRERQERIEEHQRALSSAYGMRRGWQRAAERFPLKALARVSGADEEWEHEFTDHRSFWMLAGKPIAVVAHLYSCDDERRDAARDWAARRGLRATFPVDFPSWWYPGRTTLIEITRAS